MPENLRQAADWLGARLKAAPRPAKVAPPVQVDELPLFVTEPIKTSAKPSAAVVTQRGG